MPSFAVAHRGHVVVNSSKMKIESLAIALALPAIMCAFAAGPSPDAAVAALVARHSEQVEAGDNAAAASSCRTALSSGALGRFSPVATAMLGIDLIAEGNAEEGAKTLARLVLANAAGSDQVAVAADIQARRWLSRLDREKVVAALKAYYAANVEYPPSLDALRSMKSAPPLLDRWKEPWTYRLANFKALKGVSAQRYTLESRKVGRSSDLKKAIAARAASSAPEGWRVSKAGGSDSGAIMVEAPGGERSVMREGSDRSGIRFVCLAGQNALFSTGDDWFIIPLSKGGQK